jgi:hypothetical protein
MRLSKTVWMILGIAVFVIGAVVIFMLYQGQTDKRQEARDELESAQGTVLLLLQQKGNVETELVDKKNELVQWQDTIEQLEEQVAQLDKTLIQTQEEFPVSAESIEYDEKLFSIALNNDVELSILTASELSEVTVDGINYETASFGIEARGEVVNILTFINEIVNEDEFKTAAIDQANLSIPQPLSSEELENLEEELRTRLTSEALTKITAEEIMVYTLEAINEVVGDEFIDQITSGNDGNLDVLSLTEMAETIKERITDSIYLEQEYEGPLADNLVKLIRDYISGSVVNTVVSSMANQIAGIITPWEIIEGEEDENGEGEEENVEVVYDRAALVELLGEDMTALLGDEIAGATAGNVSNILNDFIAGLIENKMLNSVVNSVEETVENTLPNMIEEIEKPSTSIAITIYLYQGEGE